LCGEAGMGIFRTMKVLRLLRNLLIAVAAIILVALLLVGGVWLYFHPHLEVKKGVVYGCGRPIRTESGSC
jgi:high-affinity Fe2+/Pb2+ permease